MAMNRFVEISRLCLAAHLVFGLAGCKKGNEGEVGSVTVSTPQANIPEEQLDSQAAKALRASLKTAVLQYLLAEDDWMRAENLYYEEILFWRDLILADAEDGRDVLVALNSVPRIEYSAYYTLMAAAFQVVEIVKRAEDLEDELALTVLAGVDYETTLKRATAVSTGPVPFFGSPVLDADEVVGSEGYQNFEKEFNAVFDRLTQPEGEVSGAGHSEEYPGADDDAE